MFRGLLVSDQYKDKLVAVAVDEAHCVKTWYVAGLNLYYVLSYVLCRVDEFCEAFSNISDIRSLIPDNVHIVALTATVTTGSFRTISERLSLKDPVLVGTKPNQFYIKYFVKHIDVLADTLSSGLQNLCLAFPKTCGLGETSILYKLIRAKLGKNLLSRRDILIFTATAWWICFIDHVRRA